MPLPYPTEEELDSCRAAGERGPASGMRVQGETKAGSPCRDLSRRKKGEAAGCAASLLHGLSGFLRLCGLLQVWVAFFAFSLAANSCFTLRAMASVSTL